MPERSGGMGFVESLTLLFIALKLTGVIAWSWVWVLSPVFVIATIMVLGETKRDARRRTLWEQRHSA